MDIDDGIGIIKKADEKHVEERAFQLYTARYPWMTEKNFITFEEFHKPQNNEQYEQKTADEIINDVREMMNSYEWR